MKGSEKALAGAMVVIELLNLGANLLTAWHVMRE